MTRPILLAILALAAAATGVLLWLSGRGLYPAGSWDRYQTLDDFLATDEMQAVQPGERLWPGMLTHTATVPPTNTYTVTTANIGHLYPTPRRSDA